MLGAEVILLVVGGIALTFLIPLLAPLWASAAALLGMLMITALDVAMWSYSGLVLPLAALDTHDRDALHSQHGLRLLRGSALQAPVHRALRAVRPAGAGGQDGEDPQKYTMEPHNADLTILFSDVRGFTSISEALSRSTCASTSTTT